MKVAVLIAAITVLALLASQPMRGVPSPVSAQAIDASADLHAAIKAYVEGQGGQFAGDCRTAQTGASVGKYCYAIQSLSTDRADVSIGLALSDEMAVVTFTKVNGVWSTSAGGCRVTPNSPYQAGVNAVTLISESLPGKPCAAQEIEAAIEAASGGRQVTAIWFFVGGAWQYYLPQFPGVGTLVGVPGRVAALYAVLG